VVERDLAAGEQLALEVPMRRLADLEVTVLNSGACRSPVRRSRSPRWSSERTWAIGCANGPITGQFELRAGTTNQAGDLVAVGAAISLVTGV
jgi:hypothetical protein